MIPVTKISFLRRTIFAFFYFHMPERRYYLLSYKAQDDDITSFVPNSYSFNKLHHLNEKRIAISERIVSLSNLSSECYHCGGRCCQSNYNHFTALDYILRIKSEKPIDEFGKLDKLVSLPVLFLGNLKSLLQQEHRTTGKSNQISNRKSGCPDLASHGCALSPEDRPIRCLLWTCRSFRNSLQYNTFIKLGFCMKALSLVGIQAFKLYHDQKISDQITHNF